jgi:replication factor C subunit 3/5
MEFYRPKQFDDIVLEPLNRKIFQNIIETSRFPNLLFYGPPGTGKTTTAINLIYAYQEKIYGTKKSDLIIHLNASDDRGIDIIRNQIYAFVNSKQIVQKGIKFVILDEADYMTKTAQQALKHIMQNNVTVRYCLMCNYISKIDDGLQDEFIRMRFNKLPAEDIRRFLSTICTKENIVLSSEHLENIQQLFHSDIRSMLNYIQSNRIQLEKEMHVIHRQTWETMLQMISQKKSMDALQKYIKNTSKKYEIDKKTILIHFISFIIFHYPLYATSAFLSFAEKIAHSQIKEDLLVNYFLSKMTQLFPPTPNANPIPHTITNTLYNPISINKNETEYII